MYGSLSTHVLRCDGAPVPIALTSLPMTQTEAVPDPEVLEDLLPVLAADSLPRVIVLGSDPALAGVLTHLLRTERLRVEVGYVPVEKSYASRAYQLPTGNAAAKRALEGQATEVPLIRDDTGTALVGRAEIVGTGGQKLEGEAYVDETRLFSGEVMAMLISPTVDEPGVRATVQKRLYRRRWVAGRAAQLGTPAAMVTRDGTQGEHTVRRASFYRHHEPLLLVR